MIVRPEKTSLVTAPNAFPVTLTEAKAQLNFSQSTDDTIITRFIHAVTDQAEKWTGRKFVAQTYDAYADGWPADGEFKLPFGWLQSVTGVYYTDTDGTETEWAATEYDVDTVSALGGIRLGYEKTYPTTTLTPTNPIRIRYTCGRWHGAAWEDATVYAANAIVTPTEAAFTGFAYRTTLGGTSDAAEPTWPTTVAASVVDNTVTWECVGKCVDPVVRNAILILMATYYEERSDIVITQGGIMLDLGRFKRQLGFLKLYYDI